VPAFLAFVDRPWTQVRVIDVQAYLESRQDKAPGTRTMACAALKSLLTFAHETGYLTYRRIGCAIPTLHTRSTVVRPFIWFNKR